MRRTAFCGFFAEKRLFERDSTLGEPLSAGFSQKNGSLNVISRLESRFLQVFRRKTAL